MTKHAGKATRAALRILFWTLIVLLALLATGALGIFVSKWIVTVADAMAAFSGALIALWVVFAGFTLYFFRDPRPVEPKSATDIVAPAHGKVDVVDETTEQEFMQGPCRRVSIFLSVFDVHVQRAPASGRLDFIRHREGKFLNAMKTEAAEHNENVLMGFTLREDPQTRIGLRLIAGLLARRILPWAKKGEEVARSERISLIQFGSRCDLYLPLETKLLVKPGDKVKGGETVVATFAK